MDFFIWQELAAYENMLNAVTLTAKVNFNLYFWKDK